MTLAKTVTVQQYMTESPLTLGAEQPMSVAHQLMRRHDLRHLPVLSGGKIVGVLSAGDLHLLETLKDINPDQITVEEAMTPDPYCVTRTTALAEVVSTMADHKYGSAVVAEHGKVVGIFTTVDACRALAALLQKA